MRERGTHHFERDDRLGGGAGIRGRGFLSLCLTRFLHRGEAFRVRQQLQGALARAALDKAGHFLLVQAIERLPVDGQDLLTRNDHARGFSIFALAAHYHVPPRVCLPIKGHAERGWH